MAALYAFEPPSERVRELRASGEAILEEGPVPAETHLRTLRQLPLQQLLAVTQPCGDSGQDDSSDEAPCFTASTTEAEAARVHAGAQAASKLLAAEAEARNLTRMLELMRGRKHLLPMQLVDVWGGAEGGVEGGAEGGAEGGGEGGADGVSESAAEPSSNPPASSTAALDAAALHRKQQQLKEAAAALRRRVSPPFHHPHVTAHFPHLPPPPPTPIQWRPRIERAAADVDEAAHASGLAGRVLADRHDRRAPPARRSCDWRLAQDAHSARARWCRCARGCRRWRCRWDARWRRDAE